MAASREPLQDGMEMRDWSLSRNRAASVVHYEFLGRQRSYA
jgi:hypothetical protein